MNNENELNKLMESLIAALAAKVTSKEVTAAELNVARQLLKDNNIDAIAAKDTPLGDLIKELPFEINTEIG